MEDDAMDPESGEHVEPVDGDSVEPTVVRNLRMLRARMEEERLEAIRLTERK